MFDIPVDIIHTATTISADSIVEKKESLRLKSLIKDKFFHHELFSSISKVLVQENILTCKKISDIGPSTQYLDSAKFSPNGNYVVTTCYFGKKAVVWQLNKGAWENIYEIKHKISTIIADFSPDSKNLVTTSFEKTVKISTCVNGIWVLIDEIEHEHPVENAYFSPDGNSIITITEDGKSNILIFKDEKWTKFEDIKIAIEGENISTKTARFSPNGNYIIIATHDLLALILEPHNIWMWYINDVKKLSDTIISVAFSHDGSRLIITCEDNTLTIFVLTGREWRKEYCITHDSAVISAIFSPDGKHLVTVFDDYGAKIWEVLNGKWHEKAFISPESKLHEAEFSPDGNHLLTCSNDKTAKIWGIVDDKWQEKATMIHEHPVMGARFNPTGTQVITIALESGPAYIWVLKSKSKQELQEKDFIEQKTNF